MVLEEHRHEDLRFDSGQPMQLDVFVPELKLAFEYQGEQHYQTIHSWGSHEDILFRDEQKRQGCARHGINLIEVPFWWDFQMSSLVGSIKMARPELLPDMEGEPIPHIQPTHKSSQEDSK